MNDRQSSGPSPEQVQETLHGVVESVVYQNEKTFYTVLELVTDEGYLVTAVGRIPHAGEGEELLLYGCWVEHSEYGKQFSVASYEKQLPQSA